MNTSETSKKCAAIMWVGEQKMNWTHIENGPRSKNKLPSAPPETWKDHADDFTQDWLQATHVIKTCKQLIYKEHQVRQRWQPKYQSFPNDMWFRMVSDALLLTNSKIAYEIWGQGLIRGTDYFVKMLRQKSIGMILGYYLGQSRFSYLLFGSLLILKRLRLCK